MALDTYANLQTAIGNFLNRSDLSSVIPDFITLAEAQMLRRIGAAWQQGRMLPRRMVTRNAAFAIGAELVNLPSDFMGPLSLTIDSEAVQLVYLKPESLARKKALRGASATAGIPAFYSVVGSQLQFLPAPDTSYSGTLVYWQKPTALSVSNPSNWILSDHPDVYLYGALTQSAPYLADDGRIPVWGNLFTTGLEDLVNADPLPGDGAVLSADDALLPGSNSTGFDIQAGDFPP